MNQSVFQEHRILLSQIKKTIDNPEKSRNDKLQDICQFLADEIDVFDWVGFYLVDPDANRELVLGPYVGEATDHTRIPFGTGICGQAAETNETFVVQDVSQEDNYLACSVEVEAEIVVPVRKNGEFVAELDIDSHTKDSLTEEHQKLLEEVCTIVAELF
jgi:GAF domain-containing protein